jgi:hypothetical protein
MKMKALMIALTAMVAVTTATAARPHHEYTEKESYAKWQMPCAVYRGCTKKEAAIHEQGLRELEAHGWGMYPQGQFHTPVFSKRPAR